MSKVKTMTMDEVFRKHLGERMKYVRKVAGLTQRQLAEACGLTQNSWSQFESGLRMPSVMQLLTLCHYTNTRMDYLMGFSDRHRDAAFSILDLEEALTCLAMFSDVEIEGDGTKITLDVKNSANKRYLLEMMQRVLEAQEHANKRIKEEVSLEDLEREYREFQHNSHRLDSVYRMIAGERIYDR